MTMIKKNDILKSKRGFEDRKVLEIYGDIYFLGYEQYGDTSIDIVNLKKLERDYVIPKEEFVPEHGQVYWYISSLGEVKSSRWYGVASDRPIKNFLGVYPDPASAEQALAEIKERLKK